MLSNPRPLSPGQQQLAADHYHLALRLARRQFFRWDGGFPYDDLLSAAHFALVRAARHYDASRYSRPFTAIATVAIKREMYSFLRSHDALRRRLSQPDGDSSDPLDHRTLPPDQQADNAELLELVKSLVRPRVWDVLHSRFIEGCTLQESGAAVGGAKVTAHRLIAEAAETCRRQHPTLARE